MKKSTKTPLLLFIAAIISTLLHNFLSGLFGTEDAIFFILTFVFLLAFIISLIYNFIKNKNYTYLIIFIIILISFIAGVFLMPQVPDQMASHWNASGEVDGYMSKRWGVFLMPLVSIALFLLFIIIPKIDPLKKNIEKFRKHFNRFILLIFIFLFYIHTLTILWNLDCRFNMTNMILPAIGLLFLYIGILLKYAKRNWFIGIRTPWTLSNDKVWDKTHQLGSKLYIISGIIAILSIFIQKYAIWLILVPAIGVAIFLIVYSYVIYQKK